MAEYDEHADKNDKKRNDLHTTLFLVVCILFLIIVIIILLYYPDQVKKVVSGVLGLAAVFIGSYIFKR